MMESSGVKGASTMPGKGGTGFPVSYLFSSLAEENNVRAFNKPQNWGKKEGRLPINNPQRIELPLFFNTPGRVAPKPARRRAHFIS